MEFSRILTFCKGFVAFRHLVTARMRFRNGIAEINCSCPNVGFGNVVAKVVWGRQCKLGLLRHKPLWKAGVLIGVVGPCHVQAEVEVSKKLCERLTERSNTVQFGGRVGIS